MDEIIILLILFQDFDHGKVIEQPVPDGLEVKAGQCVDWTLAQYYGQAEVVEVFTEHETRMMKVRKLS